MNWIKENKVELIFLVVVAMFVNVVAYLNSCGFTIQFHDTDDFMRLVRTNENFSSGNLLNTIVSRCNYPFGGELHWTCFYDLLWIVPVWLINIFANSLRESIEITGFIISPLLSVLYVLIFYKIMAQVLEKKNAFLAAALLAGHPFVLACHIFGRADYHAFLIFMIILYISFIVKAVAENFIKHSTCIISAVIAALCLWASPETIIPLAVIDLVLFAFAIFKKVNIKYLYFKNLFTACIIAMIVHATGAILSYALAISMVLLLTPYIYFKDGFKKDIILGNWHLFALLVITLCLPNIGATEYDKLSCLHFSIYLYSALFFAINMMYMKCDKSSRIVYALCWIGIMSAIFFAIYPKSIYFMGADIDPYVREVWFKKVIEMQSPYQTGMYIPFSVFEITVLVCVGAKIKNLLSNKLTKNGLLWWCLVANAIVYAILAACANRMIPYAAIFSIPFIVDFSFNAKATLSRYWSIIIAICLTFSMEFIHDYSDNTNYSSVDKSKSTDDQGKEAAFFNLVDNLSATPVVLMAHSNFGPKLLYYTKHYVIAAPYHRQTYGITMAHKILLKDFDAAEVQRLLKQSHSDYIIINKNLCNRKATKSFSDILAKYANYNGWIDEAVVPDIIKKMVTIVPIPDDFKNMIIAKVIK